jgi:hypothetical protein
MEGADVSGQNAVPPRRQTHDTRDRSGPSLLFGFAFEKFGPPTDRIIYLLGQVAILRGDFEKLRFQPGLFRRDHCARNALRNFHDWGCCSTAPRRAIPNSSFAIA